MIAITLPWPPRELHPNASDRTRFGEPMRFLMQDALKFSGDGCLQWPFNKDENGYPLVRSRGRARRAHRILCEAAHGPQPSSDKREVAHGCGKPWCVNPSHLRWATRKENEADKILHGTTNRGERQGQSKLTAGDVLRIRELEGTMSRRKIAELYGVKSGAIDKIIWGQRWSWL